MNPIIELLNMPVSDMQACIEEAKEFIEEGNIAGWKAALMLKLIKDIDPKFIPRAKEEYAGYIFEPASKKTYYYDNDINYNNLKAEIKKREEICKAISSTFIDQETGEIYEPAYFKSTDYLKISKKK